MRMLRGSITALVTPFRDGEIDWPAFAGLIERQITEGSHGLVLCGTTAESPVLSHDEHIRIVEKGIELVKRRIPVIVGTGSNATAKTVELTAHAKNAGADAALIVTPYYNKPTQEGLYAHYSTVAKAVPIPMFIYNIPGRCVIDMNIETMARLAKIPNIVGVKDATGDPGRPLQVLREIGPDFIQLCGEDALTGEFLSNGGHGCISVTSNLVPGPCAQIQNLWTKGEKEQALLLHQRLMPLHKALFFETSPAPVKYALSRLGLCTDEMRLPLVSASAACRRLLDKAMHETGIDSRQAA